MILNIILINLFGLIVGYLIGSINIAIIITKIKYKTDIRKHGSNNAGSTNALRIYGYKVALIIFIFDILKSFLPLMFFSLIQQNSLNSLNIFINIIPQIVALGAVIGHIFPLYFKFKGGKGAASLLGAFFGINLIVVFIGIIIFLLIVYISKYVSLGSIIAPFILILISFIPWIILGELGFLNWRLNSNYYWINTIILFVSYLFVLFSHKQNIKRLINKTESKLKFKKRT